MDTQDYQWFLGQDLSKYVGQWICIVDEKIVAAHRELQRVLDFVEKNRLQPKATITRVSGNHVVLYAHL